jgi:hypothetical protein
MSKRLDIIYPLGNASQWNDNELRYSLRSLELYGVNVGNVYIVGKRMPEFIQNATFIKEQSKCMNYHSRISEAYYLACLSGISDDFIIMNDDFFLTEKTDFTTFKNKVRDYDLRQHTARYGTGYHYGRQIKRTAEYLSTYLHFDNHYPMKFNRLKFIEIFEQHKEKLINIESVLIRSLYGNIVNEQTEVLADLKINRKFDKQTILNLISNRFCFSVGDGGLTQIMKEVLKELYPIKSKYDI